MKKDEYEDLRVGMSVVSTYTGAMTRHRVIAIDRDGLHGDRPTIQVTEWPLRSNGGWVDVALFYIEDEGSAPHKENERSVQR